jgi:hypothetical protein
MKKFAFILIINIFVNGCAVTRLYDKNEVVLKDANGKILNGQWENDSGISIYIECGPSIYSIMVSPIVPLPPIIPMMGVGKEKTGIRIYSEASKKLVVNSVTISGMLVSPFLRKENTFYSQSNYSIGASCKELSGSTISINILEPEALSLSFFVVDSQSTLKMDFGYLGE